MVQQLRICLQCRRCRLDPWVRKIPWRRKWQPTPVFLPGESHGWRSLVGYSPWGHKESDRTEVTEHILWNMGYAGIFPGGSISKETACNAGDPGSTPGSRRSPGEGNGNLLQYSCLEKSMATGPLWATLQGSTKRWTRLTACVHAWLCPAVCNPTDCSLPDSSVHGIFSARILD